MLAIGGLAGSLFFPPNHTSMIGSVPERNRGVATGAVVTLFGLSNILGIALANVLMSVVFKARTALVTPSPANPSAFVGAINVTFSVAVVVCLVAFVLCSTHPGRLRKDRD
jgi:MFS family permease